MSAIFHQSEINVLFYKMNPSFAHHSSHCKLTTAHADLSVIHFIDPSTVLYNVSRADRANTQDKVTPPNSRKLLLFPLKTTAVPESALEPVMI